MPASSFIFKCLPLLLAFALSACEDIPRDNPLDPKNPDSYRAQSATIEAFVNTENDEQYNQYMIMALNTIKERYGNKVAIFHFHRNVAHFTDSLSLSENDILYDSYINFLGSEKGVPDVFINGPKTRIKGASSVEAALERIEEYLQPYLLTNSYFTLEPVLSRQDGVVYASVNIARLGSLAVENIYLRMAVTERIDNRYLSQVVRHVQISNLIPAMEPGERKAISFSRFNMRSDPNLRIQMMVISNEDLSILQCIEEPLP